MGKQQPLIQERTLYVAHEGRQLAAWWNVPPPSRTVNDRIAHRWPKFSAPDVWHPECNTDWRQACADLVHANLLPSQTSFRLVAVENEWAARGIELAKKATAPKRRKKPDPGVDGLFAAADVAPTHFKPRAAKSKKAVDRA